MKASLEKSKTKKCSKCGEVKGVEDFSKDKNRKDELYSYCKECVNNNSKIHYLKNKDKINKVHREYGKKYRLENKYKRKEYKLKNKEKIRQKNKEWYLNNIEIIKIKAKEHRLKNEEKYKENSRIASKKWLDKNREKARMLTKKWREKNIEKVKEKDKKYRLENKDKIKKRMKIYNEKNKEKIKEREKNNSIKNKEREKKYREINREKINQYRKNRTRTDLIYKLKRNIRCLIYNSLLKEGYIKKSRTHEILGCTIPEFKNHIESQWKPWMSWENHGKYNGELNYGWDLDHIIPLASAKTEEEMIKLNHYTNFQPLCSKINRYIKRDKMQPLEEFIV